MNTSTMSIFGKILGGRKDRQEQESSGFSPNVWKALYKAGWTSDREVREIEEEYQNALGERWLPIAGEFVRRFGRLSLENTLWIGPIKATEFHSEFEKAEAVAGVKCCPLAGSNYIGDGCTIWIDEKGRFYAIDSEGMVFVGDRVESALDVLLFGAKPQAPPPELKEALERAYEWNKVPPVVE